MDGPPSRAARPFKAGRLLKIRSGFRYRIEVYYEATLIGGLDNLVLDPREILDARPVRRYMPVGSRKLIAASASSTVAVSSLRRHPWAASIARFSLSVMPSRVPASHSQTRVGPSRSQKSGSPWQRAG
ncbi:MAG: hypothetical protein JWM19_6542 [Actinomycetia bacterium]|nr:hypothetical protein [Actinomycetes bacterium]